MMQLIKQNEITVIADKALFLPNSISFSESEELLIADGGNNRVCLISDQYQKCIGSFGIGESKFKEPVGFFSYLGKYYVCDYKSSHLGNDFDDYHHDALLINVEKNYYDLQYLIYCLALHRHLKHSLADYDIEQHFGGIYYFYLRGMAGNVSETNTYNGVYYRKITAAELIQLDDIFSGAIS